MVDVMVSPCMHEDPAIQALQECAHQVAEEAKAQQAEEWAEDNAIIGRLVSAACHVSVCFILFSWTTLFFLYFNHSFPFSYTHDLVSYDFTHITSIPYFTHVPIDFTFSHDSYLSLTDAQPPLIAAQSSLTQCAVMTHTYLYQKSL